MLAFFTIPVAILTAIYTAFLFAQAEGRDMWQSQATPVHMGLQMLYLGSGLLLSIGAFTELDGELMGWSKVIFVASVVLSLGVMLVGEFGAPRASEIAERAAKEITRGRYRNHFWFGGALLGHVVPVALAYAGPDVALVPALLAAAVGLYLYEYAFVMAPQEIPNS